MRFEKTIDVIWVVSVQKAANVISDEIKLFSSVGAWDYYREAVHNLKNELWKEISDEKEDVQRYVHTEEIKLTTGFGHDGEYTVFSASDINEKHAKYCGAVMIKPYIVDADSLLDLYDPEKMQPRKVYG